MLDEGLAFFLPSPIDCGPAQFAVKSVLIAIVMADA